MNLSTREESPTAHPRTRGLGLTRQDSQKLLHVALARCPLSWLELFLLPRMPGVKSCVFYKHRPSPAVSGCARRQLRSWKKKSIGWKIHTAPGDPETQGNVVRIQGISAVWFGNLEQNPGRKCPGLGVAEHSWELGIENQLRLFFFFWEFMREICWWWIKLQWFMSIKSLSLDSRASLGDWNPS